MMSSTWRRWGRNEWYQAINENFEVSVSVCFVFEGQVTQISAVVSGQITAEIKEFVVCVCGAELDNDHYDAVMTV
jgi:hypothetical protein